VTTGRTPRPIWAARWLAARLLWGPDAELIRHDLDDLYAADRANGGSAWRGHRRYLRRLLTSAYHVRRDSLERSSRAAAGWLRMLGRGEAAEDVRFALRLFRRHPTPIAIAIGGLALAIGVATSAFTILDAALLRPYGMDAPSSVVVVDNAGVHRGWPYWPYAQFRALQAQSRLSQVEASHSSTVRFSTTAGGDQLSRRVRFVSGGFLDLLGGRPSLGRSLQPSDDLPSSPPVAAISYRFWSAVLGADPDIAGRVLWLNGAPLTVVGVLRPEFTGPFDADDRPAVWAPLAALDDVLGGAALDLASAVEVEVIARLAAGASLGAAQEDINAILHQSDTRPAEARSARPRVARLDRVASPVDGADGVEAYAVVAFVFCLVGLVLAVACANTANLLLAAATARRSEMGVRLALGATTARLVRQMVNESLFLSLTAGTVGFVLAAWLTPLLSRTLAFSEELTTQPDIRALAFTIGVAMVCGVVAGLSPARHGSRGHILAALRSQHGSTGASRRSPLRSSFIGFQAAVSTLLIVAALLLARSALVMSRADNGYDLERLLTLSIEPQRPGFSDSTFRQRTLDVLRGLPTVERVALTQTPPFDFSREVDRFSADGTPIGSGSITPVAYELFVQRTDAAFLRAAGLRLLRGRWFTEPEVTAAAPVAVVSASAARLFFHDSNPLGEPLSRIPARREGDASAIVIGVVGDALMSWPYGQSYGSIYRPIDLDYTNVPAGRINPPGLLIRSSNPAVAQRAIATALRQIDPLRRPIASYVKERRDLFLANQRVLSALALPLAALTLGLATLGVFGVTAFSVGQRAHEVSLRLAIGASPTNVLTLLLRDSLRPVVIGIAAGLSAALAASHFMASQLAGISPYDSASVALSMLAIAASTLPAVAIPSRRIARTNPAILLKQA
jgi:predicted permease